MLVVSAIDCDTVVRSPQLTMSADDLKQLDNGSSVPGLGSNDTGGPGALLPHINIWTVPVNGYISPVLVLFTLTTNAVVCAVLLRPGAVLMSYYF